MLQNNSQILTNTCLCSMKAWSVRISGRGEPHCNTLDCIKVTKQSNYILVFVYIYKTNVIPSNPVKECLLSDRGDDKSTFRKKALPIYWENSQYLKSPLLICISDDLLYPSHFVERCNETPSVSAVSLFAIIYYLKQSGTVLEYHAFAFSITVWDSAL